MKKYTHKSGHYIAQEDQYGGIVITLLAGCGTDINRTVANFPSVVSKDLIKDSRDWIEMVEVPLSEYHSQKEIKEALDKAEINLGNNIARYGLSLPSWKLISIFKQNFLTFLKSK
jgi:hypothetical protein